MPEILVLLPWPNTKGAHCAPFSSKAILTKRQALDRAAPLMRLGRYPVAKDPAMTQRDTAAFDRFRINPSVKLPLGFPSCSILVQLIL
jgi:hypothetical protein